MAELGRCQGQLALLWSPCACYLIPQLSINFSSWVVFRSSWMLIVTFLVASRLIAVLAGSYWGTSTPLTLSGCGASGTARIGSISFGRSVGAPLVLAPILLSCIYWTWFFLPLFFSLLCSVLIPLGKSLRNTIHNICYPSSTGRQSLTESSQQSCDTTYNMILTVARWIE